MRVNKKICVAILFVFTCITAILGMTACENGEIPPTISGHTHTYTETVSEKYLKSSATCTQKAVYYKSLVLVAKRERKHSNTATF